ALALDDLGVGVEDFGELAMQADADIRGKCGMLRHQTLGGAHDELEMRDVVAVLRSDHEKFILMGRASVQAVSAVEHEYLERRDAAVEREMLHLIDVPGFDRRNVITVIDPEMP